MSGGGTSAEPPQAFKRAVKKIKCAAMVANLAKSWQGWASDHADKQDAIPSGWMPSSLDQQDKKERNHVVKLTITPRVVAEDTSDTASAIRTGSVTKTVQPKRSECSSGGDLVSAIRGKMEAAPEESKPFLGNESPTRRRHLRALHGAGGGVIHDRKLMLQDRNSRSSSQDTEDSGLGDETTSGDNGSDAKTETTDVKKQTSRPKIKITTTGDIKSRWQQWSEQHVEGQKLNPFSEDFDHDYAMSQRLRKGDCGYGRPKEGSKTAERGDRAHRHIHREMEEMVWIIRDMGFKDRDGRSMVTFGRLFDRYVKISDKVVGILLRCRKHKMLHFEGEMLWKGQDDHVVITLTD
uniref:actin-binding Rho-activating protein n=1 Tax=Doryrhamphus excisus TaxID=161450 RepID=UPI0025AE014A|nr:actin-binding Rho-activating protein [Doryrhamphus excisus]